MEEVVTQTESSPVGGGAAPKANLQLGRMDSAGTESRHAAVGARVPEGPGAWPMLLLIAAVTVMVSGASRLEVDGPASFDLRSWLFGWAPAAFLVFGVWLVLNWAREKTTHAPRWPLGICFSLSPRFRSA